MIGTSPQCYIQGFKVIVHEKKIFEGFIPYLNMAVILVM